MKTLINLITCIIVMQSSTLFAQWTLIESGTDKELFSVHFPSDSVGYIVGREATVIKTTDGGNVWASVETGLDWELFLSTYFINDSVGFITGSTNGKVLKTINGGSSWSITTLATTNDLNDIKFINDSIGFIVGYRELWKTIDQGNNWISQYENQDLAFPVFYSLEFLNKDTVFIAGVDGSTGRILKTTDGGNDWTSTSFSEFMRFDVKFINDSVGYNVGSGSDIYKTVDGGANWSLIADPNIDNNRKLYFINDSTGYAVGYNGHIISTTDGGVTWVNNETNTLADLQWIYFVNEHNGFVVGDSGVILNLRTEVVTSITKSEDDMIQVFPNPASDILNVKIMKVQQQEIHFSIYNNLGEMVYHEKSLDHEIRNGKNLIVSDLKNGLYYLVIQTSKIRINKKMIVSH